MDMEQAAIEQLKTASGMAFAVYRLPLVVTAFGGKEGSVCATLAERTGIPFEVLHNHTRADTPETVILFVKSFAAWKQNGLSEKLPINPFYQCDFYRVGVYRHPARQLYQRRWRLRPRATAFKVARKIQKIGSKVSV